MISLNNLLKLFQETRNSFSQMEFSIIYPPWLFTWLCALSNRVPPRPHPGAFKLPPGPRGLPRIAPPGWTSLRPKQDPPGPPSRNLGTLQQRAFYGNLVGHPRGPSGPLQSPCTCLCKSCPPQLASRNTNATGMLRRMSFMSCV